MAKITIPELGKIIDVDIPEGLSNQDVVDMILDNPKAYGVDAPQTPKPTGFAGAIDEAGPGKDLGYINAAMRGFGAGVFPPMEAVTKPVMGGMEALGGGDYEQGVKGYEGEQEFLKENYPGTYHGSELVGAFTPAGVPWKVAQMANRAFGVGKASTRAPGIMNAIKNIMGQTVRGAGAGATGSTAITGLGDIKNIIEGDVDPTKYAISAGLGGTFGGALSGLGATLGGLKGVAGKQKQTIMKDKAIESKTGAIQKQLEGTKIVDEMSESMVSDTIKEAASKYKKGTGAIFNRDAAKFLSDGSASPIKTYTKIISTLDDVGAIEMKNGKPVLKMVKIGDGNVMYLPKKSKLGLRGKDMSGEAQTLTKDEMKGMFDALETIQNPKSQSVKGLQKMKEMFQGKVNWQDPSTKKVAATTGMELRGDVVEEVASQYGDDAAKMLNETYKVYGKRSDFSKWVGKELLGKKDTPKSPEQMYNKVFKYVTDSPEKAAEFKKLVGQESYDKITGSVVNQILKSGRTLRGSGQSNQFKPNTFLNQMRKYDLGGANDKLKRTLDKDTYAKVKKLNDLAEDALNNYDMTSIPLEGTYFTAAGKPRVASSLQKAVGAKSDKVKSLTMDIMRAFGNLAVKSEGMMKATEKGLGLGQKAMDIMSKGSQIGIGKGQKLMEETKSK